jgi:hypothetical protein
MDSMVEVELAHILLSAVGRRHRSRSSCPWVVLGVSPIVGRVKERVVSYHVRAHLVRPFQDLGSDVIQEGI